jgi:pre-mRNA-splicing factor ATP-dependent RNA helicase DHX15/PRP43
MGSERKRKLSLFDVVDDSALAKTKANGVSTVNPYTGRPYSQRYYEILEKRRTLPVWLQKQEFLDILAKNQTMILVGETGSGKTTQVCNFDCARLLFIT